MSETYPMWQVVVHGKMDGEFADEINLTLKENA